MRSRSFALFAVGHKLTRKGIEMVIDFAGRIGHQSGQRFLDGSVPRLIRHVALCETAGRGFPSLPAGKDQKPSREFEGGALIGREAPVPLLSLPYYRAIVTSEMGGSRDGA